VLSRFIEVVQSRSIDDDLIMWMNTTCGNILDMKVAPASAIVEDVDDTDGLLSRHLFVPAFLSVTPKVFGSNLGMMFLQRSAGIADWDEDIPPKHLKEKHSWLVKDSLEIGSMHFMDLVCSNCSQ
jgi:hypothetical protein